MPIPAVSHLVPAGGKDFPLLEDFHLMGSYRVVATIDDRNALHQRKRKAFTGTKWCNRHPGRELLLFLSQG